VSGIATTTDAATVDITGGAPEINPNFRWLVSECRALGRHVKAADTIAGKVDLVVLPENIVNVRGFVAGSPQHDALVALARRLHTTLVAGVVEDRNDPHHFWNAVVAIGPDGRDLGRYDKVRRVPFGEYVPLRFMLDPLAKGILPPRDATPGTKPAVLDTPAGRVAVAISWEVFFPRRVREGLHHDAEIVLNPTNGSSYWLTQVQTQQVASSALRAEETGRWVLQAAPTGFSAIVDPDGTVVQRSGIGEAHVLRATVHLRRGQTLATLLGDVPALVLAGVLLVLAARRRRARPGAEAGIPPYGVADETAVPSAGDED
jgi:apolipoprotein N-acyltransferase